MSILPKAIKDSMQSLSKFQCNFHRNLTTILKFAWDHKRLQKAKAIMKRKNKAGGITLPGSKLHYKAIVIKTVWYWHKNRNRSVGQGAQKYTDTYMAN